MFVFLNGQILSESKAHLSIWDRGFLLGDGIFETVRLRNGDLEYFREHYQRL